MNFRKSLYWALNQTIRKRIPPLIVAVIGFFVSFLLLKKFSGESVALDHAVIWINSLIGSATAIFMFFIFNLLRAPYSLAAETSDQHRSAIEEYKKAIKEKDNKISIQNIELNRYRDKLPNIEIRFDNIICGDVEDRPAVRSLLIFLTVKNTGGGPTGLFDWSVTVECLGELLRCHLVVAGEHSLEQLGKNIDGYISGSNSIVKKGQEFPIPPGGRAQGYIIAELNREEITLERLMQCSLIVTCTDVNDRNYEQRYDIPAGKRNKFTPYLSGIDYRKRN